MVPLYKPWQFYVGLAVYVLLGFLLGKGIDSGMDGSLIAFFFFPAFIFAVYFVFGWMIRAIDLMQAHRTGKKKSHAEWIQAMLAALILVASISIFIESLIPIEEKQGNLIAVVAATFALISILLCIGLVFAIQMIFISNVLQPEYGDDPPWIVIREWLLIIQFIPLTFPHLYDEVQTILSSPPSGDPT